MGGYLIDDNYGKNSKLLIKFRRFSFTFFLIIVETSLFYKIRKAISDNDDDEMVGGIMRLKADTAQA